VSTRRPRMWAFQFDPLALGPLFDIGDDGVEQLAITALECEPSHEWHRREEHLG